MLDIDLGAITPFGYICLRIFVTITNLTMLMPIIYSLKSYPKKRIFEIFVFLNVFLWSSIYHMCDYDSGINDYYYCLMDLHDLRYLDFLFSIQTIPIIALNAIAEKNSVYKIFIYFLWFVINAIFISYRNIDVYYVSYLIVGAIVIICPRLIWLYCKKQLPIEKYKNIKKKFAVYALINYTIALTLFALDWIYNYNIVYDIFHGFWHITVMTGIYFTMKMYDPLTQYVNRIISLPNMHNLVSHISDNNLNTYEYKHPDNITISQIHQFPQSPNNISI